MNLKLVLSFGAGVILTLLVLNVVDKDVEGVESMVDVSDSEEVVMTETSEDSEAVMNDPVESPVAEVTAEAVPVVQTDSKPTVTTPAVVPTAAPYVSPYPYSASVSFTGSRFVPEEALIIKGGLVTFKNNSSKKMWIASNLHLKHDAYPEVSATDCAGSTFDQCTSVNPGGTWTFAFSKIGKWFYHEENRPVATGRVRVITTGDYDTEF